LVLENITFGIRKYYR